MASEGVGKRRDGQGQALTATSPACTAQANAILLALLTCWGRGMQAWQCLVLTGSRQWLETEEELTQWVGNRQGRAPKQARVPPSYLSVLNQEAGAVAIGALRALPAASTADAAHAALAAHAIPVTCCGVEWGGGGGAQAQRSELTLLTAAWQLASAQ